MNHILCNSYRTMDSFIKISFVLHKPNVKKKVHQCIFKKIFKSGFQHILHTIITLILEEKLIKKQNKF